VTDPNQRLERTCFQSERGYIPEIDIKSDVAIVYGIGPDTVQKIESWRKEGYVIHLMTGVSWGNYQDYLNGQWDGKNHWDEAQTMKDGKPRLHGGSKDVPYMCPGPEYGKYLCGGVKKAISMGYKNIAVTTSSSDALVQLSKLEEENPAVNIYRFAVHTTGMSREGADDVFAHADVATGCASKYIREHRMANRVFRVGESVPIFGITERGKRFIEERLWLIRKPNIPKQGARLPDNLS
jgi:hypothetical protein